LTNDPRAELRALLISFVEGRDRSIPHVNRIEVLLEREFPFDPKFEELVLAAATYQPGGGENLVDADDMARICAAALRELA
jgi:hypothetical protein